LGPQPQRGDRTRSPRNLSPLRGWFPFTLQITAHAVSCSLSVLRTWALHFRTRWGCQLDCEPSRPDRTSRPQTGLIARASIPSFRSPPPASIHVDRPLDDPCRDRRTDRVADVHPGRLHPAIHRHAPGAFLDERHRLHRLGRVLRPHQSVRLSERGAKSPIDG
jgi:hypothetical protein